MFIAAALASESQGNAGTRSCMEGTAKGALAGLIVISRPVAVMNAEDCFARMVIPMTQTLAVLAVSCRAFIRNFCAMSVQLKTGT